MSVAYSDTQATFDLNGGLSLERADSRTDFSAHWAAYRPNEGFYQDWTQRYSDLQNVPFRFWIVDNNQRIGGCLVRPNLIAELFTIPPFHDAETVMTHLLPIIKEWSDDNRPIYGRYILPEQIKAFEKHGFTVS
ncbi:MAG: hypothetical protein AAF846_13135 [Chloroflexota bacterium]